MLSLSNSAINVCEWIYLYSMHIHFTDICIVNTKLAWTWNLWTWFLVD